MKRIAPLMSTSKVQVIRPVIECSRQNSDLTWSREKLVSNTDITRNRKYSQTSMAIVRQDGICKVEGVFNDISVGDDAKTRRKMAGKSQLK